ELKEKGANNINLVTPDHFAPKIIYVLKKAKEKGLNLPIVYNTSGYCDENIIKLLDGLVDIYLTDFKYFNCETAERYSSAYDYPQVAKKALKSMVNLVGKPTFLKNGIMKRGVIVRHLCLPNCANETKNILDYLYSEYKDDIIISIMNQFTPISLEKYPELNRKITEEEYQNIVDYANLIGINNAYIQEGDTAKESFIPSFFELEGV
ncbi:MAG: radical SAM protein, partial [Clostridia bacterium]|nr:radical SAM protein [Clostridia bacterium]